MNKTSKCPNCGKSIASNELSSQNTQKSYKPFCSKRCADVDLGKWFNESYFVEGGIEDEVEEF